MNATITAKMTEAKMDARMVAEAAMDYESAEGLAFAAVSDGGSPIANKIASDAAVAWINAYEDKALEIINKRIAKRAEQAERLASISTDKALGL